MTKPDTAAPDAAISSVAMLDGGFQKQARRFLGDFAAFAGMEGIWGAVLAIAGAVFESVGLVLLVPLLGIVTASGSAPGWIQRVALRILEMTGAHTRNAQLSVLLGAFAGLIVIRAVVTARRDVTLSRLQIGFVEHVRRGLAGKLAAAPWPAISRLQHARVTNLLTGDIQRIGSAALFTVQLSTAAVLTSFQIAIAFVLGPALAAVALLLIAVGAVASFAVLGRAHSIGARLSHTNVALMHETTQFLGGLKLAAGQNRQADFVNEFEASLAAVEARAIRLHPAAEPQPPHGHDRLRLDRRPHRICRFDHIRHAAAGPDRHAAGVRADLGAGAADRPGPAAARPYAAGLCGRRPTRTRTRRVPEPARRTAAPPPSCPAPSSFAT